MLDYLKKLLHLKTPEEIEAKKKQKRQARGRREHTRKVLKKEREMRRQRAKPVEFWVGWGGSEPSWCGIKEWISFVEIFALGFWTWELLFWFYFLSSSFYIYILIGS